jgi:outer membrane receptor for ferrienterochelin and colicins
MWPCLVLLLTCLSQNALPIQPTNASPTAPQQPDPPLTIDETVVVTATRADRRLQDEPLRVEIIDREEIEEKALMTPGSVAMLLGETTGLRVQTTAPSMGAANVRIQGLRGRYAQLLADGLPLYGASGDSFSLLQVPPLDLGQVEIIKGAASALYGPAALGGVVNLVSRRPRATEREALFNVTSQAGADVTFWLAEEPRAGWSWTLLGGFHGQPRRDLDADGWTDLAGYGRAVVRPRVFFEDGRGRSLFLTGGFIAENRDGGTVAGGVAPDGNPFAEALDTRRADVGALGRWLAGAAVVTIRGSYARLGHDRLFGDVRERSSRHTWFGEGSVSGTTGRHTWVVGGAMQQDRHVPRDVARFAYRFTAPAVFAQDEILLGPAASVSVSARADVHSEYGTLMSPRLSLLLRPAGEWTTRVSVGAGWFAPTPFTEETDETGLSRLAPFHGLRAEHARGASADLTWVRAPFELTGTVFGSHLRDAVHLTEAGHLPGSAQTLFPVRLVNAPEPTRTWGTELLARYRRGEFITMVTHGYTRSTEFHLETLRRREVPLTPRHAASFNVMWEGDGWGRAGFEAYFTGRQRLDDSPYRDASRRYVLFGGLFERRVGAARLFINVENLANIRQTAYDPLIRPTRRSDGRWTVDAWAPLDGRVWNGGVRVSF